MELTLNDVEATELRDLLDGALGDLSSEIADTANPGYRLGLKERRTHLQALRDRLVRAGPTLIAEVAVGVGVYLVVDGALGLAGR